MLMLLDNTAAIYIWRCPRCGNEEPAEEGEESLECACDLWRPECRRKLNFEQMYDGMLAEMREKPFVKKEFDECMKPYMKQLEEDAADVQRMNVSEELTELPPSRIWKKMEENVLRDIEYERERARRLADSKENR